MHDLLQEMIAFSTERALNEQEQAHATESPEFKRWFGKSAVVDKAGNPLVVYHGTNHEGITEFFGGWWTDTPAVTREFGNQQYKAYLSIQNPIEDDAGMLAEKSPMHLEYEKFNGEEMDIEDIEADQNLIDIVGSDGPFTRYLKDQGYDGMAVWDMSNAGGDSMVYLPFSSKQIKLLAN